MTACESSCVTVHEISNTWSSDRIVSCSIYIRNGRKNNRQILVTGTVKDQLVETEAVFAEDEGYALAKQDDSLYIELIDDHHVSVSFQESIIQKTF